MPTGHAHSHERGHAATARHPHREPREATEASTGASAEHAETDRPGTPHAPGGTMSPARAMALQRAVGNATVSRLVRDERDEREGPDGNGGAEGAGGPEVGLEIQRSAVHSVLSSPGRPLGGSLLAEMESRFGGADFSDVRLHTGSAAKKATAEMGAKGLTTGNHIVLDGNASDKGTLAHELRHVEQQRSGPVPGTDLGNGMRVSDPADSAERDAEATARRVMSASAPAVASSAPGPVRAGTPQRGAATAASAGVAGGSVQRAPRADGCTAEEHVPVQRKVAAQVTADPMTGGNATVKRVILAGRPDKVFPGTEGNHTTAYTVMSTGLRRAVRGKTALEARTAVAELFQKAKVLPGGSLIDNLEGKHADLIQAAAQAIERLLAVPDGSWDLVRLQDLIAEYLQYRGLLPLSTVNVKASGSGWFGEGRAEGSHKAKLEAHEKGEAVSDDAVRKAVMGMFDERAAAIAALDMDPKVSPGIDEDGDRAELIGSYVEQHLVSVRRVFPRAIDFAWPSRDDAVKELTAAVNAALEEERGKITEKLQKQLIERRRAHNKAEVAKTVAQMNHYGIDVPAEEPAGRGARGKATAEAAAKDADAPPPPSPLRKAAHKFGSAMHVSNPFSSKKRGGPSDEAEDTSETLGFATRIGLSDGDAVQDIDIVGRPKSRFSGGKQGSHVTAWIVHLDIVERALKGLKVGEALDAVAGMVEEVEAMLRTLEGDASGATAEGAAPEGAETEVAGDDTGLAAGMAGLRLDLDAESDDEADLQAEGEGVGSVRLDAMIQRAEAEMREAAKRAKDAMADGTPLDLQVLALQQATRAVLSRINLIKGVAFEAVSATGKGEAKHRDVLKRANESKAKASRTDVEEAILGLLDLSDMDDEERMLVFAKNHLDLIERAYPVAYQRSRLSAEEVVRIKRGKNKGKGKLKKTPVAL